MSKAYVYGFVAGLLLLIVAGVIGFQAQRKDPEEEAYRAEVVDATPAQIGVLTAKQRIHSNFFTRYQQVRDRTISETVARAKGKTRLVEIIIFLGLGPALIEPETPENYFGELADTSSTVIRGRVIDKVSHITEDGAFVLTDYSVTVTEVLKNNALAHLDSGATISVIHPGGKVVLDGIIVKANDQAFTPLPINNHEVVLFLQYIPETESYRLTRNTGSFELDGPVLRPLTKDKFPPGVLQEANLFLQTTRAVSKQ